MLLDASSLSPEEGTGANASGMPSLQSLGAILRDRRESAGIPLAEVEEATRIRQKYLAAIEADEWHLLPGEVVGRGFLRNYAYFLNLDPNQMVDRRRAMVDSSLSRTLAGTSTGVRLPPVRQVDYRPKDVDLENTDFSTRMSESFESIRDWLVPILAAILIVLIALIIFWSARQVSGQFGIIIDAVQDRITTTIGDQDAGNGQTSDPEVGVVAIETEPAVAPTATLPIPAPTATATPNPTATTTPQPTATEEPLPSPTPTVTPTATATEEPEEEPPPPAPVGPPPPPPIVPVSCADGRLAISSPGSNQNVSGVVQVTGRAVHEQFDSFKLEWAPGAGAENQFTWFDGSDKSGSGGGKGPQVENGILGNFNSAALPNGVYTLMLTVIDTSKNYPTPCRVTINVQN